MNDEGVGELMLPEIGRRHPDHGAALVLQLYDLRREAKLREAREWFAAWTPLEAEEAIAAWRGSETSPRYRMITTYWDMACALVNHGAIDAALFHDTTNEHAYTFVKLEPFLPELRRLSGIEWYLNQLERCVLGMPANRLAWTRGRIARSRDEERQRRTGAKP